MNYHLSKTVSLDFDAAVAKVPADLKAQGVGVLTQIDAQQSLRAKLGVDFRRHLILGACDPPFFASAGLDCYVG